LTLFCCCLLLRRGTYSTLLPYTSLFRSRGNLDRMVTDTRMLLIEGLKLAQATFAAARQALGWVVDELDEFVIHQVSRVHTQAFRSEEHTSELQSRENLVCRLLLETKKNK